MIFIIPGRFQPFHKGHLYIVDSIIKESDADDDIAVQIVHPGDHKLNERRPFPVKVVKELVIKGLGRLRSRVSITVSNNIWFDVTLEALGYVPPEEYYDQVVLCVGEDRAPILQKNASKYGYKVLNFSRSSITSMYSGTMVREALINNDYDTYKRLMPKPTATKSYFNKLRRYVLQWAD